MRVKILISLAIVVAIGCALKFYRGPGDEWINNLGPPSIPCEMMFMLIAFFFFPERKSVIPIAVGVCAVTCALEFMQLWKPPWLMAIRDTFAGRALLGNTFSWWDLPAYPVGCLVGYWYLLWLLKGDNIPESSKIGICFSASHQFYQKRTLLTRILYTFFQLSGIFCLYREALHVTCERNSSHCNES